jgi:N-acetylglutamate synthase-like GNAT family acetyltransferase
MKLTATGSAVQQDRSDSEPQRPAAGDGGHPAGPGVRPVGQALIRKATLDDLPRLARLGGILHGESDYAQYDFSIEKVYEYLYSLVDSPDGIMQVGEEADEIVGAFIGCVGSHWFGDCKVSYDLALFVAPKRRGTMLCARLVKAYIRAATDLGVDEILIGNSTAVRSDRVDMVERLYERLGFRRRSGNYAFRGRAS